MQISHIRVLPINTHPNEDLHEPNIPQFETLRVSEGVTGSVVSCLQKVGRITGKVATALNPVRMD